MKVVNLTPHVINIADLVGNIVRSIEPAGQAARVTTSNVKGTPIDGIPFVETFFGQVENLPEPQKDTIYVVSQIVIAAVPERRDLVRPDTGPSCVRDAEGKIIAVRALTR